MTVLGVIVAFTLGGGFLMLGIMFLMGEADDSFYNVAFFTIGCLAGMTIWGIVQSFVIWELPPTEIAGSRSQVIEVRQAANNDYIVIRENDAIISTPGATRIEIVDKGEDGEYDAWYECADSKYWGTGPKTFVVEIPKNAIGNTIYSSTSD